MNDWDDAEQRVEHAQELFEQRRWREALELLRAATDINPYNAAWHFNIGLTLDEMERFDEAIQAYRHVLEIEPNDLHAMTRLGADLRRVGKLDDALAVFEQVESADPSYESAYCHRILVYADRNDHEKAEEMFYLARLFKEQCPDCYHNLALSLLSRDQLDKAVWCFRRVHDLEPAYPGIDVRIADVLWRKGELDGARQHFLSALRRQPGDIDTLLELGDLLIEMGRIDEAGEKFGRAVELAPEQPSGYFRQGEWLVRFGGHGGSERAMAAFRRTLSLDPTFPGVHLRIAALHQARGERTLARKHLRAEMLLRPQDPQRLLEMANLLIDVGLVRAAVACLRRLVSIDSDNADAWQNLAVAQFLCDRFHEGIESCRRCLSVDAGNVMVIYNLALAHERLGQYEQASYWVGEGLRLAPRDATLQRLELRVRILRWRDWIGRGLRNVLFPAKTAR